MERWANKDVKLLETTLSILSFLQSNFSYVLYSR